MADLFTEFTDIVNKLKNLEDKLNTEPENKLKIKKLSEQGIDPIDRFNQLSYSINELKIITDEFSIVYVLSANKIVQIDRLLEPLNKIRQYIENTDKFEHFVKGANEFRDFIEPINKFVSYIENYNFFIKQSE